MPKILSEEEKNLIKEALHKKGIQLIREKGLRHVTVDDLTKAVGIAKGTFYAYYPTKEELLCEIFLQAEQKMMDTILAAKISDVTFYETVVWALTEIYLAPDSIALYILPEDLEYLMRKLPNNAELKNDSRENYKRTARFLGVNEQDSVTYGVLTYLMMGLQYIATCKSVLGESGRQESLNQIVNTIATFLQHRRECDE